MKRVIHELVEELGPYRENLRSVVPFDTALMYAAYDLVDEDSYVLVDISEDVLHIQFVEKRKIKTGISIGPFPESAGEESLSSELVGEIRSNLIMVLKMARPSFVYLNIRRDGEKTGEVVKSLLGDMDVSYQELPHFRYEKNLRSDNGAGTADALTLYGLQQQLQLQPAERLNLLKDEFKPRMKGYVSLKDFSIVGVLLLVLLVLSTTGLTIDIQTKKNQVFSLRERLNNLSSEVYGDPSVTIQEAGALVEEIEEQINLLKASTDRRLSSMQLLKELSFYIPQDVEMEYSDIIIERDRVRLSGKARTFSDIDRIREGLMVSDYFYDVRVANTGTTGSTEGFTVTFTFDINVVEELPFED
jgi:hypothetical protein